MSFPKPQNFRESSHIYTPPSPIPHPLHLRTSLISPPHRITRPPHPHECDPMTPTHLPTSKSRVIVPSCDTTSCTTAHLTQNSHDQQHPLHSSIDFSIYNLSSLLPPTRPISNSPRHPALSPPIEHQRKPKTRASEPPPKKSKNAIITPSKTP